MGKKAKRVAKPKSETTSLYKLGWWVVAASSFAIPLAVSPAGKDSFRLPKDSLFRAEGVLAIALLALAAVWGRIPWREVRWKSPAVNIPLVAVIWTGITTALSTNRALSTGSLRTVVFWAAIFIVTALILRRKSETALLPLLAAASINGVVYLFQELGIWNPFGMTTAFSGHNASSAFLGNANDVGSALLGPVLAAFAMAIAAGSRRILYTSMAALLLVTLLVSRSITAIAAAIAGMAVMATVRWGRRAALPLLVLLLVTIGLAMSITPLRARIHSLGTLATRHDFDRLLGGRPSAFRAATHMFLDHPVAGLGPGTFGWHYMAYKLQFQNRQTGDASDSDTVHLNFEEVHNDHLEVLAETGLPGYAILLAALAFLGVISFRAIPAEAVTAASPPQTVVARLLALPLAAGFFILALAQYPLQLASATSALLFLAAACVTWSRNENL